MTDPTPADIEAGQDAILALLAEHPDALHPWSRIVAEVLRAVLPDRDARVRAHIAQAIEALPEVKDTCGCVYGVVWRDEAASIARAHATAPEGDTDG